MIRNKRRMIMKVKKFLFTNPKGILLFYKLRVVREKLVLAKYNDDASFLKVQYKKRFSRELDLKNPKTFTEKLQWLKLFYRNNDMTICSDKYGVRKYLKEKGYGHLLNELIGVYEDANQIDFDYLPDKFVAKATHGSSWNLICKDKKTLNWPVWKMILNSWLKLNLYVMGREWNYKDISPRIIIERFIDYEPLIDYKFMCFNGEPKFVQVNNDYEGVHYVDFYSINWNKADFTYKGYKKSNRLLDKPPLFDEMLMIARDLSKPFPFVRVDFYNFDKTIIFGELTFFPGGGLTPIIPAESRYDEIWGEWLQLPQPNYNQELYSKLHLND